MHFKDILKKSVLLSIVFLTVVLSSCFFSAPEANLVTPVIRVLEAPAASMVDSVVLTVSGPDMDDVEVSYSTLPDMISIAIPEGDNRTFELEINMNSSFPGTIKSFRGTATSNVTSDSATVTLGMGIGSTKIIVPDANNHRLVQIDDISGSSWSVLYGSDISTFLNTDINFYPSDVDFDSSGNIYVANGNPTYGGIYQFFSINYTEPISVLSTGSGYKVVAVDRKNNIVYGVEDSNNTVHYKNMNTNMDGSFTSGIAYILGMAVDEMGYIYLSGDDSGNTAFLIEKYKSIGTEMVDSFSDWSPTGVAGDCVVYDDYLYVTSDDGNIYQLNSQDFTNSGQITDMTEFPTVSGSFNTPCNFLATMNDQITVLDDGDSVLISFNGINSSGFKSFGSYGTGEKQFSFFEGGFYSGGE